MKLGDFSLSIINYPEDNKGYVRIPHDTQYMIEMRSHTSVRSEAKLEVDGKLIGTWRLDAFERLRLERPANSNQCFTFYSVGTMEASQSGLVNDDKLGLVQVTFVPEKVKYQPQYMSKSVGSLGGATSKGSRSAGGTGLSGHSNQQFVTVANLELDTSKGVKINLRLIPDAGINPLVSIVQSNPVPPRV